ncbi:MAG: choice-of-anchor D domain-containing protein [Burkholderiaceae bacterium]|nr:choice-of-anchor D domain-containing protein [Burkholderiaceae bacterium]
MPSRTSSSCAPQILLQPTASCQARIALTPAAGQVRPVVMRWGAVANPASIDYGEPQPRARFSYSAAGLAFGARPLGATAPRQSVRVVNAGTVPLAVAERRLDGAAAADFALEGCAVGSVLAPGATCRLDVDFTPSAAGARSATLTLASPDAVEPMTLTLTGAGKVTGAGPAPAPPASPPPPPPAQPQVGATSNAGGGGALPRIVLFVLLFVAALRWRNRHGSAHPG